MTAKDVHMALRAAATPERAKANAWFFKTEKGQYGYGDKFLGVRVPDQRKIAKQFKALRLKETEKLVMSPWHEERLTGLFILVGQFQKGNEQIQQEIYHFYISHAQNINNWDLVDSSASYIVGPWLDDKPEKMRVLTALAKSDNLWEKRIAMLATFYYIGQGKTEEAFQVIDILLHDEHDLIQKAVGWMLREIGKRASREQLMKFLDKHAANMPRTTLRYAIEHFSPEERAVYLQMCSNAARPERSLL